MSNFPITGTLPTKFEAVREAALKNHAENEEAGFQFCVMHKGEVLVDICGGYADKSQSVHVNSEHLFSVYSSGKAIAAIVIAHLAENDRLGYDQNILSIWPDFGEHGKGDLSIAQILSHQAGLSGITNPDWDAQDWYDWDKTCAQLAAQIPIYPPASTSGYHPLTFGFLAGEIARRTDKQMRSLGQILREDLTNPAGADVWIGLPETEHHRCAYMQKPKRLADLGEITPATRAAFLQKYSAPGGRPRPDWLQAEFAASNCQASAKGLAILMQVGVNGFIGNMPVLSEDMLGHFSKSRISGQDQVLPFEIDFAAGVMRNTHNLFYGPNPNTLGHSGWGGSCVFADPDNGLHGAYVMNNQHNSLLGDVRACRLIDAIYAAI
ncbi:MAG: serine hydrolase domain-containing protein [Litorimonas sp.]